jgi:hypothetical protein
MATVWHPIWDPVWNTITGSNMVAVLDTNLVPKMGSFLPLSTNGAFLGTKMVPSMRHLLLLDQDDYRQNNRLRLGCTSV